MAGAKYTFQWMERVSDLPQAAWDALAQPLKTPFFEWDWLCNLEQSGSATAQTGWQPLHLVAWRGDELVAAAPLYLKSHSYGEFVFDHQWADLAAHLGLNYYPKLLGMAPFTPAVGYRFLIAPSEDEGEMTAMLMQVIDQFCNRNGILACNFLYVDPDWKVHLERCGFVTWMHHNSVWHSQNFKTYEDYLKMFNANQRRNIKREMKAIERAGLQMTTFTGDDITSDLLMRMYAFYSHHCDKFGYWGSKYLTKTFFEQLHKNFRHRLLLVAAVRPEAPLQPEGMSFCVYKGDRLYGRYWGSFQEYDCLHFNACYYKPIEWAIEHDIQVFDPGAGGRHKKRRGFPATPHYSMHRFYQDRFDLILRSHLVKVNELEVEEIEAINNDMPFNQREVVLKLNQ